MATSVPGSSPAGAGGLLFGTGFGTGNTPYNGLGLGIGSGILGGNLSGQDQEEERQRRLENIIAILGGSWGRVSQEGLERCAKRLKLECLWEPSLRVGPSQARILSIAGREFLVEVDCQGDEVKGVTLTFPANADAVDIVEKGAEVLKSDLTGGQNYIMLDSFAKNLGSLAKLDGLGSQGVSCFEAVEAMCHSLWGIFSWERTQLREEGWENPETEVVCRRSGRPMMHAGQRLGLALQFWMERRLLLRKNWDAGDMVIDRVPKSEDEREQNPKFWSAIIECEPSPAELYTPIRVSDAWVSETLEWQEPPLTFQTPSDPQATGEEMDTGAFLQGKPLDVRFVAKFEPPIVVPLQVAEEIFGVVGTNLPQGAIQPIYEALLFPDVFQSATKPSEQVDLGIKQFAVKRLLTYPQRRFIEFSLVSRQQQPAFVINQIPFSHPQQLVSIFPVLRQWALAGSILRRTFTTMAEETVDEENNNDSDSDSEAFGSLEVNIMLGVWPVLRITIFILQEGNLTGTTLIIGLNGEITSEPLIELTNQNPKAARVLTIAENIATVVEWMTSQ
ncbi:hypothetical protein MMC12_002583 [Toensbergia leucococca]|nr:hypothetical protein [Toensbergia leucococca]